ncbi:fibroblast growth factor receptor substrate 2-like [Eucyclogobius newberryi]|uniref:fibroblast growth factor receptor substrate 2-like n=1 Tax=Eucyclogobius newberryi TaxID=166745 RepID=UPI003B5A54C5
MGGCLSCPQKESIPDTHQSKFKVINVDDDGNELGCGVMELTEAELVLHTHRRDDVRWPYLCLRRYGYDSNLFSFESGRRCQTGQGIFAFKCARAEEIFNLLQEVMHSHSISVVEEDVHPGAPIHQGAPITHTPAPGYSVPNGVTRLPSLGDTSHPSTRHPSVASTRLPSVGEESTHPLLVSDDQVHTYVNTTGLEGQSSSPTVVTPLDSPTSPPCPPTPPPPPRAPPVASTPPAVPAEPAAPAPEPSVQVEGSAVRFVLGPTPVQRQQMQQQKHKDQTETVKQDKDQSESTKTEEAGPQPNGSTSCTPCRQRPPPLTPDPNINNSALRRPVLLDYGNLPPVWEVRSQVADEPPTPSALNGFSCAPHSALYSAAPLSALSHSGHGHYYVNTENVTAPLSAHVALRSRRPIDTPTVFNFDFRRPLEGQTLNYVEVETDLNHSPASPRTPTSPAPGTRRTELYALIDIERTAAMSSLQKARPKDDGTARKTRHNSTELPTKTTA